MSCNPECRVCAVAAQYGLTDPYIYLIAMVCCGMADLEIAAVRRRSIWTVKRQLKIVYRKTRTHDRLKLLAWARGEGIGGGFGGWADEINHENAQ